MARNEAKCDRVRVKSEWIRRAMRWAFVSATLMLTLTLVHGCSRTRLKPALIEAQSDERLRPPDDTQLVVFETIDKVDLLFVIDNSPSMADKQELLRQAVPTLLERLINPPCISVVDPNDAVAVEGPGARCPAGYEKEFEPLIDLHVGVITSSLGGHGGDLCTPVSVAPDPTQNDRAHLLASVREGLDAYDSAGFLAWDPAGSKNPPGDGEVGSFIVSFQDHVAAAGEVGCGHEATQEAWYRFLVEPNPYEKVVSDGAFAFQEGTDEVLLEQRAAFVRPDSLLMIVVLSDEDDCSVVDGGLGWIISSTGGPGPSFNLPPATSVCYTDPNHRCCRSCGLLEEAPPPGCAPLARDPGCRASEPLGGDSLNMRCHRQKQRFGFDLLYPVERYSGALKERAVFDLRNCDREEQDEASADGCPLLPNPLFVGRRDPSMIIYTAIVGVPWQDIASSESLTGPTLEYLSHGELEALGRWEVILGDPEAGVPPLDPLMIAQSEPRTGVHPITGEPVAPIHSTDPQANSINGHEFVNTDDTEPQYACIFPLETPRVCSDSFSCDCADRDLNKDRPLCKPPGGGPAGLTQYFAKAYPGLRHLEVAKQLGDAASIASVCPKTTTPPTAAPSFGYNPAAQHMYQRLAGGLGERCLATPLPHTSDGRAECVLWQLRDGDCDCAAAGLQEVDAQALESVQRMLEFECSFQRRFDCERACACQLPQLRGSELAACQESALASGIDGWCSIDPSQGIGDPQFVTDCRVGHPRTLRLLGNLERLKDEALFLTCPE